MISLKVLPLTKDGATSLKRVAFGADVVAVAGAPNRGGAAAVLLPVAVEVDAAAGAKKVAGAAGVVVAGASVFLAASAAGAKLKRLPPAGAGVAAALIMRQ